jgi:5'-phosphate synthase pdxT subunit
VRVNRNHFGRQTESFQSLLALPFLTTPSCDAHDPFRAIFIRAPIVEKLLPHSQGAQESESALPGTVIAPSRPLLAGLDPALKAAPVEVLARVAGRAAAPKLEGEMATEEHGGDIVAVRQANVFGTSFHPELTGDPRIHGWWLGEVVKAVEGQTPA